MKTVIFAKKHTGMKICLSGVLKAAGKGGKYARDQLVKHIDLMGSEYYSGNTEIVDQFLQLYCITEDKREEALKKSWPKTIDEETLESLSLANCGLEIANTHLQQEINDLKQKLSKYE